MEDVARIAGVSRQTVSRVINGKGEISPVTRKRIMEVIQNLGYSPNRAAQGLAMQRTHTAGFVIPDITNPFFPEVAKGIQDLAQDRDYNIIMCNTGEDPEEATRILYSLVAQAVDGIIIFSSDEFLIRFAEKFRPIVAINYPSEHSNISILSVDNYRGAQLAVDHLVAQGHTNIGMVTGDYQGLDEIRRVKGFREALMKHGLPIVDNWVVPVPPTLVDGREAARQLLIDHPQITAIFAYNDLLAIGSIRACSDLGRRVPADCAIIGFDDIQLADIVTPALTSVRVDKYALGQQAMARLFEMIESPEKEFSRIEIDVELVIREST